MVNNDWQGEALPSSFGFTNKVYRLLWNVTYLLLFRLSPKGFHAWRRLLLRCFGAEIGRGAVVHNSVKIWGPWNLTLGEFSAIAPEVDLYCVDAVSIGSYSVISQRSFICTASHDYKKINLPLVTKPISIGSYVWVCAEAFLAPGITIEDSAVVLARSVVTKNVFKEEVVAGHPACKIRMRYQ
jgi:putative colanic acid biosynthesis acetyltransferase WcaF